MKVVTGAIAALSTLVLFAAVSPRAKADDWNKKTVVTFKEPVEIPGHVLLPGTYVFKLMNSDTDRDIVTVRSEPGNQLEAIELAAPAYRLRSTNHSVFQFEQRSPQSPEAIKDWYYPGDLIGIQFLYPTQPAGAEELAASHTHGKGASA